MRKSHFINRMRQYFYRPGKGGFLSTETFKDMEEIDRMLDKSVKRLTGKGKKKES